MDIKNFVKAGIRSLSAYEVKEIPCKVKLDANESPYGFKGLLKALKFIKTNRYPDPEARFLKKFISRDFGVKPENILHGNGSDELIYYLITTFGGPVLFPIPTFSMYGIISQALGEKRIAIPLEKEFDLDLEKILKAIKNQKPKLIFLSSPNNPTGNCFSSDRILKIIEVSNGIVIVDEAYQPFASDKGFMPMLKDYKNIVIMRTLSKIGLAGLRVGFLIADEEIINEVNKVRLPFNLNSLSQAAAVEVLKNKKVLKSCIKSITSERGRLFGEMAKIKGIKPYPSEANFILFRIKEPDKIYKGLLKKGILVRNMSGVVNNCLRVTVGTPEENMGFIKVLKEVI
ncbi:MAG: histidinol-phosphate transaminase [Nitrospirae bacterium CG_4_10_14_0_8_um_filter_41_23]|nr:histidinol-phosphate transaminase [Nitrospirota bacterium]OIP60664.1 MAG: histidinol-phosphate transaminase [Nitrospirae bacterium CG2_30_41_42]PIQ93080.1 MAG: histidinol-phosphate transaminase [Nitrospirae bacterium CG11_big_fil_rev_8_21_14_0_20_41_14]PIV43776.1 MAG: histidinol-phosphate transaminase [Nitrospirae bacterium CG02_land_8_20_14_3_00_41_53]PIW87881.1 MAG: histidinol-phosphate transaminase [Nitrospirae bacterium CG_4_8_14_3_um_filter_41_47]PIY86626.1 MAG: histidinol-phosphate tr